MNIGNLLKNVCKSLGENNKPTYVVIAIAAVKGICRPAFTMMDKTENPETKKYTALREGLTEVIAIPVYWACGEIAGKFGKSIAEKGTEIELEKKGGIYTKEMKEDMKNAAIKKGQKGLMFIGVCTAALFVIPGLCSLIIKPVMNSFGLKPRENKKLDIIEGDTQNSLKPAEMSRLYSVYKPNMNNYLFKVNNGMKVGGSV